MRIIKINNGYEEIYKTIKVELINKGLKVVFIKKNHNINDWDFECNEIIVELNNQTMIKTNNNIKLYSLLKFIEEIEPVDFVFLVGFNEPDYFNLSLENYNENINEIINLIEERSFAMIAKLNCKKCGYNTCQKFIEAKIKGLAKKEIQCLSGKDMTFLKVNDTIISMNPFVNTLIENIIFSLVESLKNDDIEMDKIKDIELKIKK